MCILFDELTGQTHIYIYIVYKSARSEAPPEMPTILLDLCVAIVYCKLVWLSATGPCVFFFLLSWLIRSTPFRQTAWRITKLCKRTMTSVIKLNPGACEICGRGQLHSIPFLSACAVMTMGREVRPSIDAIHLVFGAVLKTVFPFCV